ncbi:MAG: glycoside-pentoside-hexuronide (GPH):cation symporter [Clostridiales bacterium]|jgi:sugar (glycoside-pentoside-hexuronide) transporter|nr:glycoside-pentoside-hexuronide (GPH):cation symporter [Clostridiales bacterium]
MSSITNSIQRSLHKVFGTKPGEGLQPKEAISYSIAGLGQNLVCGLVGSYITYYFTNGLLIDSFVVGLIMLFIRLFDAFNDPIMGSIVDRTKTKDGKCRPYLKWMPIPIAVLTILLFLPLAPSTTLTIILVTAIYLLWSVVYTIVDVPYWGLATAMTCDTNQRGVILTVARLFCTIGSGIITILVPALSGSWISKYTNDAGEVLAGKESLAAEALRNNYWWLVLIIVAISIPTFYIGYKNTKERFCDNQEARPLKENLKLLFKNKPLLLIALSGILGGGKTLYLYSGIFFAAYNLTAVNATLFGMHGLALNTIITFAVIPGGLIASVLVPWFTKKFGKRNTYIYSHIIGGIALFASFLFGWDAQWKLLIGLFALVIAGVPQGFGNIVTYAMIADTVDYLELQTEQRAEGICFAIQTFMNKIGMAVGAAVSCFGLALANIKADDASTFTLENNKAGLNIMFIITILVPAISMILSAIPLFFYRFTEKEQAAAVKEIMARKGIDNNGDRIEG